jgi:hypothetical protein
MPEAGAVIEAARRFLSGPLDGSDGAVAAMEEAVAALDAKLASLGSEPSRTEQDRTWGEVVAGDEVLSVKTGKWYEVGTTVRTTEGKAKIMIKGNPKPILRTPSDPVRLKRGVEGDAVDIVEVLFSGTTRATVTRGGGDAGPMLTDKVEDDDE